MLIELSIAFAVFCSAGIILVFLSKCCVHDCEQETLKEQNANG